MKNKEKIVIISCAALHTLVTLALAITHIMTFKSSLLDDGTILQVLHTFTEYGVPLSTTNPPFKAQHWLGFHFSPILLLLMPAYAAWPSLIMLQLVQSLCIALAGLCIYCAIIALGGRKMEAFFVSLLYWCNPFVVIAAIWDFHEISFAVFAMSLALLGLCQKSFSTLMLGAIILMLTKEHYGISVTGLAVLWAIRTHDYKRSIILASVGFIGCIVIITVIMPTISGVAHPMLQTTHSYLDRYSWIHQPNPVDTFFQLLTASNAGNIPGILYLLLIASSGLMFPLIAPLYMLPASADLLANLLSTNSMPRHISMYHSATIIPVAVIAGFVGYHKLMSMKLFGKLSAYGIMGIVVITAATSGLLSYPISFWELKHIQWSMDEAPIAAIKNKLPEGEVSAQIGIGSFFAQRKTIYPFPHVTDKTNAIILHLENPFTQGPQQHFGLPFNEATEQFIHDVTIYLESPDWQVAYWQDTWLLLTRAQHKHDSQEQRVQINNALSKLATVPASQNP